MSSLSTLDTRSLKRPMAARNEPRHQRTTLAILALAAFILTLVTIVLTILNASSLFLASASFRALAAIAAICNFAALAALIVFLIQVVWRQDERWFSSRKSRALLLLLYLAPTSFASLLTIVMYALTQSHIDTVKKADSEASDLMAAKFAVWALSSLSQAVFYLAAVWMLPLSTDTQYPSEPSRSMGQEMREQLPPKSVEISLDKPPAVDPLPSPTFSAESSVWSSRNSWRASLQQVVRPISSRTRLLSRASSSLRESASFHSGQSTRTNSVSQSDAFESWDTSSVDQQSRDAIMQSTAPGLDTLKVFGPGRGTRLDPIPGSRPVSPARALDGPFPSDPAQDLDEPLPAPPTPAFMSNSPHTSRPSTPTDVDASNIHPLFRSDSPHPPPAVTPGTMVIASPFSGQVIPHPPTSRSRANSRTRANSHSRTGSPFPILDGESLRSSHSLRSLRSPSPPPRQMTPPIPEFILSDSPRASSTNLSIRKVSLTKEGDRSYHDLNGQK